MKTYQIHNNEFTVQVKSFGAELCSVKSNKTGIEYIWQANPELWPRHAPNLFPIVGKLKDGTFQYNTKSYNLPQHGFARDKDFICVEESESKLVFELTANEESLLTYPFHFSLQIAYTLCNNSLLTEYIIFNPDNTDLYFSVGAHPAFNCPLQENECFEDYILQIPNKNELIINTLNDGLIKDQTKKIELSNNELPVAVSLFENDALVLMNKQIEAISLLSTKTNHGVSMDCKGWPFFGIWTKKQSNKYVCLEPWYGIADSETTNQEFESKNGIIKLTPYNTFTCSFNLNFF